MATGASASRFGIIGYRLTDFRSGTGLAWLLRGVLAGICRADTLRDERRAGGRTPRTRVEIDAEIAALRDESEGEMRAVGRLQDMSSRTDFMDMQPVTMVRIPRPKVLR